MILSVCECKKAIKSIIFLWLIFSNSGNIFCQRKDIFPDIIQPPPTAAAFCKYGNTPVSYFTGLPNISIPLLSIKSRGQLKMDISLSYHASGIKVEEQASWVGLGWSLNAGGSISRKIVGRDDIQWMYFNTENDGTILNEFAEFSYNNSGSYYETEPDIYYYNFNGYVGKFVIDRSYNCIPVEANDLKIVFDKSNYKFSITTEEGIKYCFEDIETQTILYYYNGHNETDDKSMTNWYLTKIISPEGTVLMEFKYDKEYYQYETSRTTEKYFVQETNITGTGQTWDNIFQKYIIYGKHLTQIISSDGSNIVFESLDRFDLVPEYLSEPSPKRLCAMHAYNELGQNIKNITFQNNSYFNENLIPSSATAETKAAGYRLKLTGLTIDSDQIYQFTYNNPDELPTKISTQQDHWGYYHGRGMDNFPGHTGDLYPYGSPGASIESASAQISGVSRDASFPAMQYGTLNKITYPTKGYTQFEYQAHTTEEYLYDGYLPENFKTGGGLRIYRITDFDGKETTNVREFTYSGGMLYNKPVYYSFNVFEIYLNGGTSVGTKLVISTRNSSQIASEFSDALGYAFVTEHLINNGSNNGSINYQYNTIPQDTYNGEEIDNNYRGIITRNLASESCLSYNTILLRDYGFSPNSKSIFTIDIGRLLKKEVFDNTTSINPVREEKYNYVYSLDKSIAGIRKYSYNVNNRKFCCNAVPPCEGYDGFEYCIGYEAYKVHTGTATIESVETYQDGMHNIEEYQYNSEYHHLPTQIYTYDSDGTLRITEYKYPSEYTGTQQIQVLREMKDRHILSPVIEKKVSKMLNDVKKVISAEYYLYTTDNYKHPYKPGAFYKFESLVPVDEANFVNNNYITESYQTISEYDVDLLTDNNWENDIPYDASETIELVIPVYSRAIMSTDGWIVRNNCVNSCGSPACSYDCTEDWWNFAYGKITGPNLFSKEYYISTINQCNDCANDFDPYCVFAEDGITLGSSGSYVFRSHNQQFGNEDGHFHYESNSRLHAIVTVEQITPSVNFSHLKQQANFSYDSYGNIIQITKTNDIATSYLWDYNNSLPIAEVKNAKYSDIYNNSFEILGITDETNSKTGNKICISNYSFELPSLTNGKYILSYWKRMEGTWSLTSNIVDVTTGVYNINISASSAIPIDEVRFYPANAQMTTYTYNPLIGTTSMTDARDQTTFYEYDTFGRLYLVKDQDRNILQKHDYHFAP